MISPPPPHMPQNLKLIPLRKDIHPTNKLRRLRSKNLPGVRWTVEIPSITLVVDIIALGVPEIAVLAAGWGCAVPAGFALVPAFGGGLE